MELTGLASGSPLIILERLSLAMIIPRDSGSVMGIVRLRSTRAMRSNNYDAMPSRSTSIYGETTSTGESVCLVNTKYEGGVVRWRMLSKYGGRFLRTMKPTERHWSTNEVVGRDDDPEIWGAATFRRQSQARRRGRSRLGRNWRLVGDSWRHSDHDQTASWAFKRPRWKNDVRRTVVRLLKDGRRKLSSY